LAKLRRTAGSPLNIDAFKLSHHGSRGTHSVELMKQIRCKRFLVSSDGSRHRHPHIESIARTVRHSGGDIEIVCNYRSDEASVWDSTSLKRHYRYEIVFPADELGIASVEL
jgi:hypothetical protein